MGKKRSVNTFSSVSRKISQGYGRGEQLTYKPWLSGHEFASRGMYIRLIGRTIPRIYSFMSRLEADAFILYDCMDDVNDILEQYYLTLEETLEIADLLNIKHPTSGKYYNPLTTDLMIRRGDAWIARAVKTSRDLEDHRTIEKLEIERIYHERRGINWKIITERQLNRDLIQNLSWLWYDTTPEVISPNETFIQEAEAVFLSLYDEYILPFPVLLDRIESLFFLEPGYGINIFKSLVRKGSININLSKPINMADPLHPIERNYSHERYHSYC